MKSSKIIILLLVLNFLGCKEQNSSAENIENRLSNSASPYLREHADNPVDWYEWGEEALQKAQKENKPIIISVGYSACHWCHVMEEESFMDTAVAAIMNKDFISIKVDREERPDIDKVYMDAAQLLNGSGGWPLNVISLPDGKPFFAGTYFTKEQWMNLLEKVSYTYKENKPELVKTANELTRGILMGNSLDSLKSEKSEITSTDNYIGIKSIWQERFDKYDGGYKGSQKFPLPVSWQAMLQYYYLTGDEEILEMVDVTLKNMAEGGIYDHLGGGFARYTTDSKWVVPHFEKMLYDNAQLISLYSNAYKVTGNPEYAQIVKESIAFVEREFSNGEGGFYSSINADSKGEEGTYYVWTAKEVEQILDSEEAKIFEDFYNIESYGNWENGKNVLYRNFSEEEFAEENKIDYSKLKRTLSEARKKLLANRENREKPTIDNKIITSWNALMIQAYLDAFTSLGKEQYLQKAEETAEFLYENMIQPDHSMKRSFTSSEKSINGFLDDYSYTGNAFINLYQVNFKVKWLNRADEITKFAMRHFMDDETGMFYYTSNNGDQLITRQFEIDDNVLPSSNSVMAINLFILGELTANKEYSTRSEAMLQKVLKRVLEQPSYYANWTTLLGYKAFGVYEVAIVGEKAFEKNKVLQNEYYPTALFMGGESENLPLLKGKLVPQSTLIYVCQNKTCKYPVSEVSDARKMLNEYQSDFSSFFDL